MKFSWAYLVAGLLGLVVIGGAFATEGFQQEPWQGSERQAATPNPDVSRLEEDIEDDFPELRDDGVGAGGSNLIQVRNLTDNRFELRGNADLSKVRGNNVAPRNEARAYSSCTDCQTIAIALQLTVYKEGASSVAPVNIAVAVNENCNQCLTVAWAVQYVNPVQNTKRLPENVKELTRRINRELNELERIRTLESQDVAQIDARLSQIFADFDSLRLYLNQSREERRGRDVRETPTVSPSNAGEGTPVTQAATPTSSAP
jgi:hypothetical protein